ncbi:MAG: M28 family metallopeptidase [Candidatus Helarchaeota archaeon]
MKIKKFLIFLIFFNLFIIRTNSESTLNYTEIIDKIDTNINLNYIINITKKLCENNSRITGTLNCNYSAFFLRDYLRYLNISNIYLQKFPFNNTNTLNVVGHLKNTSILSSYILIMAHYDSISVDTIAPGANDNAASVASIIEIIRLLKILLNNTIPIRNLIILFTSGEEEGLYGSRAWILHHQQELNSLLSVINFDMIGYGSYHTIIGNEESCWLTNFILESSEINAIRISKSYATYPSTGKSDHINFMNINIPTVWIFERDQYYPWMHTAYDTIDKVNFEVVSNCVRLFTLVLYRLMTEQSEVSYLSIGISVIIIIGLMIPIVFYSIHNSLKRK